MRYLPYALASLLLSAASASAATYLFTPPVAWLNEDPANTSGTVTIYYDFRPENGYANSITSDPSKLAIVQDVLSDITAVTGGQIVFARDTNPADTSNFINIGVGNLAAISAGSGAETLGLGGATEFIPSVGTPYLGLGFAWLDSSQNWNTSIGNGNVFTAPNSGVAKIDFYSVLFHEMGHALGLDHSTSSDANIMTPYYAGQKQLPAQDDINGLRTLYPSSPATTGDYDVISRSYTSGFHVFPGDGGQYNYTNTPSGGLTQYSYVTDAGTVTVTGITDINHTTPYTNPASFEQQGGNWTDQHIQIGGTSYATAAYDFSGGTLTCPLIEVLSNGTFNMTGGTLNAAVMYNAAGTTVLGGTQNWAPGSSLTMFSGGSVTFNSDAGSATSRTLAISASAGNLVLNTTQHLASLTMTSTATATLTANENEVLVLGALSVATTARLDVTNNDILLQSSNLTADFNSLHAALLTGRNGGAGGLWTGHGITSSAASHSGTEIYTLALVRNADLADPFNATTHLFDGEAADASSILIKYTYAGDINLDGVVDLQDYQLMDAAYLNGGVGINGATGWVAGDFNYDGVVNYLDFALADASLEVQGSPLAAEMIAQHSTEFGGDYAALVAADVPEPGTLLLLALAAAPLFRRRRRGF